MYSLEKEKITRNISSEVLGEAKLAFTSDAWTSRNTTPFLSLSVHYIDLTWTMHSHCLQVCLSRVHSRCYLSYFYCFIIEIVAYLLLQID